MITLRYNSTPPTSNTSLMPVNGRLIHTDSTRKYRKQIELETVSQLTEEYKQEILNYKDCKLECHIYIKDNWFNKGNLKIKKLDIQNKHKALIDSIFAIFTTLEPSLDDSQLFVIHLHKLHDSEIKETIINIESL